MRDFTWKWLVAGPADVLVAGAESVFLPASWAARRRLVSFSLRSRLGAGARSVGQ